MFSHIQSFVIVLKVFGSSIFFILIGSILNNNNNGTKYWKHSINRTDFNLLGYRDPVEHPEPILVFFWVFFQINRYFLHRRWFLSDLRWFHRISDWHFTLGLGLFSVSGYRKFPPTCFGGFSFKVIHFQLLISGSAAAPNGLLRRKNRQTFTKSKLFALLVSWN